MAVDLIAGAGAFKVLYDSAKALKDINDASVRNSAVIELQEKILLAQEAQSALVQRIRDLEEEVRSFKTWDSEKQKYELKELGYGSLAYMLKPDMRGAEPPHWICANCYSKGQISIVQYSAIRGEGLRHACPSCKAQITPGHEAAINGNRAKWLD